MFFPSDDENAVFTYAREIDHHKGALAAWEFLASKGYSEKQIFAALSTWPRPVEESVPTESTSANAVFRFE